MHSIDTTRPAVGTWVFRVTVEQATGRMTQGLNLWSEKALDIFAGEDGLDLFWTSAEEVAQAHLKGQLIERQQQMEETREQLDNLEKSAEATAKMLGEIGA